MTKSSPNPPATQDQESTNTNQVAQTSPSNRVSLQTNREKLAAEGGSKQPEEVLPQFPAGVGRPKRYSTRRQKTEDAGTQRLKVTVVADNGGCLDGYYNREAIALCTL